MWNVKISSKFALFLFLTVILTDSILSQQYNVPEMMYFKFKNNIGLTTPNYASNPVGNNPATISGAVYSNGGQFDTCLLGTGSSGTNGVNTGWNWNLGSNRWTLSFWIKNLNETSPNIATYLFGDSGSSAFRCFYGGAATPNNILLRGPMTDIIIACPMPGEFVFHFVYDGFTIKVYRNGAFLASSNATLNMPNGTGFRIAGYRGGTYSLNPGGRMDEFRLYNRALTSEEIGATWNIELPYNPTGLPGISNSIPANFVLGQNYPNPFNPSTIISFGLPKSSFVNIVVTDILGKDVATLVNENMEAGNYKVNFDGSGLASGIYLYRIEAGEYNQTRKMTIIK